MSKKNEKHTKKIKKYSMGHKIHEDFANIISLMASNNDEYDGCLDYLFYKVINIKPIDFLISYNNEEVSEAKLCQKMFDNYCCKVKINDEIEEQMNEIIKFVRTEGIKENKLKFENNKYIPTDFFNMFYLKKKILKFYINKKKGLVV